MLCSTVNDTTRRELLHSRFIEGPQGEESARCGTAPQTRGSNVVLHDVHGFGTGLWLPPGDTHQAMIAGMTRGGFGQRADAALGVRRHEAAGVRARLMRWFYGAMAGISALLASSGALADEPTPTEPPPTAPAPTAPAPAPAPAPTAHATDVSPTASASSLPLAQVESEPPPALPLTATPRRRLRLDVPIDLTVSGVLAASLITWAVAIKPNLRAPHCTICDGAPGTVNGVDDFFRTAFKRPADSSVGVVSDVFGYGLGPAAGIALGIAVPAHDGRIDEAPENLLLVVETTLTYAVIQQGLTVLLPRERPAVHADTSPDRESLLKRHSSLESFPGGHNGLAFSVAAAGGTIATLRGYRLAPLVWIVGGTIGLATTYLRMAADRHYFTDLMAGAALGIGTGIAVPLLFHRRVGERQGAAARWLSGAMVSIDEHPGGHVARVSWRW